MGRDGEEVAQKHSEFPSTVGEPHGEGTTDSRAGTGLTSRGRKRRWGGKMYGPADLDIWDLKFT